MEPFDSATSARNSAPQPPSELLKEDTDKDHRQGGRKPNAIIGLLREVVELVVVTLFLLISIRWALAEARYIPSSSMEPTLQINDRLLVEKVSGHLGRPIQRGEILVFYPPPVELGGHDLSNEPLTVLGRLTGLPFLPYEAAFIKRVIGLPGDQVRIVSNQGVFINGQKLDESDYIKEIPNYNLNVLGDIGGHSSSGSVIRPFGDDSQANSPIIVPPGHLFMMGDNRNNSEDSHIWGFLDEKRVIGRACLLFWRRLEPPTYSPQILDK
jgi:signal peptidase I